MDLIFETERLLLRKFLITDASFILKLVNTELWIQFIGNRNVQTLNEAEDFLLNGSLKSYDQNGFGFYAVIQKSTKELIGMCGFAKRDYLEYPDLGFAYLPQYFKQGFGYEAARACLIYGHNDLKIKVILATVMPENIASIGLLEKLGFGFSKMVLLPQKETELMLFLNK